ncbi:MAG: 5'/3'-nucleotidase SurE [Myxococcota bacterium]|nr:5'/3'-nucleotidase SurE [Myxococcota bacterium]
MSGWILVTNDDGVDSPALPPLVRALAALAPVRAVVPDRERSWIGKALTRFDDLHVERATRGGIDLHTVSGTPADCAQLGIHRLFDEPPGFVVSGVNVGFNHTRGFAISSGTIGGATEASTAGIPAVAFSTGQLEGHAEWSRDVWADPEAPVWERAAGIAADVVAGLLGAGLPDGVDVLSVNFPQQAHAGTPRRLTRLAPGDYGALFRAVDGTPTRYGFHFQGRFRGAPPEAGTDLAAARDGHVSITPLRLADTAPVPESFRAALER